MRVKAAVAAFGLLVFALSGCLHEGESDEIEGDDPPEEAEQGWPEPPTPSPTNQTEEPPDGANETTPAPDNGNQTGDNATGDNETGPQTTEENRSGTASWTNLLVNSRTWASEEFAVEDGAVLIEFDVESSGGELMVCIREPEMEEGCAHEFTTEDGEGSASSDSPEGGTWTVRMSPSGGVGPQSRDYEITFRHTVGDGAEGPSEAGEDEAEAEEGDG